MFRLFRRKKKETPDKIIEEKKEEMVSNEIKQLEIISEENEDSLEPIYEVKETPFEVKFGQYAKILPESLLEEQITSDQQTMLPIIESLVDQNDTIFSFISPQVLSRQSGASVAVSESIPLIQKDLPPISLEEKIEGALFAIGRPIHTSELIDNFDEDSPTIKRAIRRLSRKKKRTSALIIEEISKDRWVFQLNPIFHELFQQLLPDLFLSTSERVVLTEIAYRQPISLALVKKMVVGIGPIKVTEICNKLEANGFVNSESRSRSLIYTSTPKFARSFGFDNDSRRLKLQMLWRLKRLMGDFEADDSEELDDLEDETETDRKDSEINKKALIDSEDDEQILDEGDAARIISQASSPHEIIVETEEEESEISGNGLKTGFSERIETESQPINESYIETFGSEEGEVKIDLANSPTDSHSNDSDQDKQIKEMDPSNNKKRTEEE